MHLCGGHYFSIFCSQHRGDGRSSKSKYLADPSSATLERALCFKISYSSWEPCNLLTFEPHLSCWEAKSCSCGHTLPKCSSSQAQQAWRSKRHRQATFAETNTCATLCFYDFAAQFGLTNINKYNRNFVLSLCARENSGRFLMCRNSSGNCWETVWLS